jgi:hypothetical protein
MAARVHAQTRARAAGTRFADHSCATGASRAAHAARSGTIGCGRSRERRMVMFGDRPVAVRIERIESGVSQLRADLQRLDRRLEAHIDAIRQEMSALTDAIEELTRPPTRDDEAKREKSG